MSADKLPTKVLVVDLGGTNVKICATGQKEARKAPSGASMGPQAMVDTVRELAGDWEYEAITLGYPGQVDAKSPRSDNVHLAPGWVSFDYAGAFGVPVKLINDAAMQALGCYEGGRMLFIGLGTGVGSALIVQRSIISLELGQLRYSRRGTLKDYLGRAALKRRGLDKWKKAVLNAASVLRKAFLPDYVMLGGGSASRIDDPPAWLRIGGNQFAFRGGFRLWGLELTGTLHPSGDHEEPPPDDLEWRLL
ncbi:MAG TPA: ROK family protein [Pirellulales bacterium]|nr:ROK family protein [Pirellulales bacterium]